MACVKRKTSKAAAVPGVRVLSTCRRSCCLFAALCATRSRFWPAHPGRCVALPAPRGERHLHRMEREDQRPRLQPGEGGPAAAGAGWPRSDRPARAPLTDGHGRESPSEPLTTRPHTHPPEGASACPAMCTLPHISLGPGRTLLLLPHRRCCAPLTVQGLRIDYVLCTPGLLSRVVSCEVLSAEVLPPKWSDHAGGMQRLGEGGGATWAHQEGGLSDAPATSTGSACCLPWWPVQRLAAWYQRIAYM